MNIFWGIKILRIFFLGSSQNWTSFRVISMHSRVFFNSVQNRNIFGVAEISNIFGKFGYA